MGRESTVIHNKLAVVEEKSQYDIESRKTEAQDLESKDETVINRLDDTITTSSIMKTAILFCGVTSILPFNMFIVAAGYFKLRLEGTKYDNSFSIYIQFVGIMSNLVGSAANIYLSKIEYIQRLTIISNLLHGGSMVIMCFFAVIDTSNWSPLFFEMSLLLLALSGLGHAVQTSCLAAVVNITSPSLNVWYVQKLKVKLLSLIKSTFISQKSCAQQVKISKHF